MQRFMARAATWAFVLSLAAPVCADPAPLSPTESIADLPLIEIPSPPGSPPARTLAVHLTGNAGYNMTDQLLGEELAAHGVPTVVLSSLRYFWHRRTPDEAALDLERILRHELSNWDREEIALTGYSMGADVLPFMLNRLPADLQARVRVVALISPGPEIDFDVHLSDLVRDAARPTALATQPEIERIAGPKLLCFCGREEPRCLCSQLSPGRAQVIAFAGGHRMGIHAAAIADSVLAALRWARRIDQQSRARYGRISTGPCDAFRSGAPSAREGLSMTTSRHPRRLCTILIVATALGICAADHVTAGTNPDFRIVLHAKPSAFEPCNGYLPVDCTSVQPTVNVQAVPLAVFVLLYNYQAASAIQTALQWTGWSRTFSLWDCLRLCDPIPCPPIFSPPNTEIITIGFTGCVTAPALVDVGRIFFVPGGGNPGCISQWDPGLPFGIHLEDCSGGFDQITDPESPRLGKICFGSGGVNACDGVVPVESTTWGQIKSTY